MIHSVCRPGLVSKRITTTVPFPVTATYRALIKLLVRCTEASVRAVRVLEEGAATSVCLNITVSPPLAVPVSSTDFC